jgi:hypothetical protein
MNAQKRDPALMLLTASGGLISAFITICGRFPLAHYAVSTSNRLLDFNQVFLPGAVFGVFVSSCFALRRYLRDFWKAIAITAASTLAYYASFLAAGGVELHNPFNFGEPRDGSISSAALLIGGLTGAGLVLCAMSLLLDSEIAWQSRLLRALRWSPAGAILGIVGWALGPSLGMVLWQIVHSMNLTGPTETFRNAQGETSHMFSLWAVWQAGIGFVLGLVVNRNKAEELARQNNQPDG